MGDAPTAHGPGVTISRKGRKKKGEEKKETREEEGRRPETGVEP